MTQLIVAAGSILALAGLDQLIKYLAIVFLQPHDTVPLIQDVLHFTYWENDGAAFGSFENLRWLLIAITLAMIVFLCYLVFVRRVQNKLVFWAATLIIAGGIGNLIDRIFRGYVIDYIDVRIINFAIFNLADCCVVIGTALLLVYFLILEPRKERLAKKSALLEEETAGEEVSQEESSVLPGEPVAETPAGEDSDA